MKKDRSWLVIIILIGVLLNSCNTSPIETVVDTATATHTAIPTKEAQATPTSLPEPTATPTVIEPTEAPTLTTEPIVAEPTQPALGSTRTTDIDQMVQVFIQAGEFIMGSTDVEAKIVIEGGRAYPEIPQHTVYVDEYWIDRYEVSTSQYALCVDDGVCELPYKNSSETREEYFGNSEYADYPVIWVSWYMATTYCDWAGRRLPTEAEWEKASRGTDGRKYPWGNEDLKYDPQAGERANFCDVNCPREIANAAFDDGFADTAPVGSYPKGASPYGVMDMSGNVWEWTSTIIQDYPYDPNDGREDPDVYKERVWRGGPWSNGYWWVRSSVRYRSIPSYWYVNLGFRCASTE